MIKHRKHVIGASFIDQHESSMTDDIVRLKACSTCTSWMHKAMDYSGHRCTKEHVNEERLEAAKHTRNKICNSPEAAHKCRVCSRCHSYIRNDRVAGQLTRLRDCKEGFKRMDSPEKTRALETVRVCTRCTSWKHRADMCRQRCMPCTNRQAGQWVLLGGSSTVRSTGGGESRIQEHVSQFATYAATMGSPSRKCARSALVLEDPGATATL